MVDGLLKVASGRLAAAQTGSRAFRALTKKREKLCFHSVTPIFLYS